MKLTSVDKLVWLGCMLLGPPGMVLWFCLTFNRDRRELER